MPTEAVDPTDVRALIPRMRRAVDGPAGAAVQSLNDDQLKHFIADTVATIIFLTSGGFAHQLNVTERDGDYGAPSQWTVTPEMDEVEQTVVAAQAALDAFRWRIGDLKASETIKDEAREWSYTTSANLMRDQFKALQDTRDRALELLVDANDQVSDVYFSYITVRDSETATLIESYVSAS